MNSRFEAFIDVSVEDSSEVLQPISIRCTVDAQSKVTTVTLVVWAELNVVSLHKSDLCIVNGLVSLGACTLT